MYIRLVQDFGLECEVAQHLSKTYGDRAFAVAKMASLTGKRWPIIGKKVHPEFPYIDAEVNLFLSMLSIILIEKIILIRACMLVKYHNCYVLCISDTLWYTRIC